MDLRERLAKLKSGLPSPSPEPRVQSPGHRAPLPYLEPVETPQGLTYRLDKIFIEYHGQVDFKNFPVLNSETLRFLTFNRALPDIELEKIAFLDIETTGTAGGTGTYAFLVGIGFVERGYFQIRQFFLHDLAMESAFLLALEEFSRRFTTLVTYNGKCFDAQILKSRYLMHRREFPLEGMDHIDMLFVARRLWKRRFRECNLMNLEQKVLSFERKDDLPGHAIPAAYTDYLRYANSSLIRQVLTHNQWDIASLAVLTARACMLSEEETGLSDHEHYSISLLHEKQKNFHKAIQHQLRALQSSRDLRAPLLLALARNLRRVKDRDGMRWLLKTVEQENLDADVCRQVAILCEHDLKDANLALQFVVAHIQKTEKFRRVGTPRPSGMDDWYRRFERLKRKKHNAPTLEMELS